MPRDRVGAPRRRTAPHPSRTPKQTRARGESDAGPRRAPISFQTVLLGESRVVPPNVRETGCLRRQRSWRAKLVPVSDTFVRGVPLRNDIGVPKEHPIQSAAGGDERITVRCKNDFVHERIDRRIPDADDVPGAWLVRCGRGPEIALLVSRRVRLSGRRQRQYQNRRCLRASSAP